MNIQVSEDAAKWYKEEYSLDEASFRLFVRYGGMGGQIPGFSLGINIESPSNIHTSTTINGLMFFIEDTDSWYFENKDLDIIYDEKKQEPVFIYK